MKKSFVRCSNCKHCVDVRVGVQNTCDVDEYGSIFITDNQRFCDLFEPKELKCPNCLWRFGINNSLHCSKSNDSCIPKTEWWKSCDAYIDRKICDSHCAYYLLINRKGYCLSSKMECCAGESCFVNIGGHNAD